MSLWSRLFSSGPEQKATSVLRALLVGLMRPAESAQPHNQNLRELADLGFRRNVTAYACIVERGRAAAGVPWVLMRRGRGSKSRVKKIVTKATWFKAQATPYARKAVESAEIESHPLLTLVEKPNPKQSKADYLEALVGYLLVSGNSYTDIVSPETGPNRNRPAELFQLRPDRTKILVASPDDKEQRLVRGYRYEVNGQREDLTPSQVIHIKFFDPIDDFYGLSPLRVAALSIATANEAQVWNYALLKNDARPPGALVTQQTLGDDTFERVKAEIIDNYQGAQNARRPLVLEGGLDWKQLAFSPADLDFLEGQRMTDGAICKVLGVPPELVGDSDRKTYNSYPEARTAFYQETVLTDLDKIRDAWNNELTIRYGDDIWLDYDRDQIEALQEDRDKLWLRVERSTVLTINEKRTALGYDEFPDPEADVPVALLNVPAEEVMPDEEDPEADPDERDEKQAFRVPSAKEQALTRQQRAARARFRRLLREHFGEQGRALAQHFERLVPATTTE